MGRFRVMSMVFVFCVVTTGAFADDAEWITSGQDIYNANSGKVGIGITIPQREVVLYRESSPTFQIVNSTTGTGPSDGSYLQQSGNNLWLVNQENANLILGTNNERKVTIQVDGNVGIGIATPDYPLSVNGTIQAKEIKVTTSVTSSEFKVNNAQWSDFVFEDGYKLPSLDNVENYIKENRHLPDVPSAQQIAEDGLSMAEMMAKQMQKIEELTLYVIELKKQNESLKTQVTEINEIKARLAVIEGKK